MHKTLDKWHNSTIGDQNTNLIENILFWFSYVVTQILA